MKNQRKLHVDLSPIGWSERDIIARKQLHAERQAGTEPHGNGEGTPHPSTPVLPRPTLQTEIEMQAAPGENNTLRVSRNEHKK